MKKRVAFLTGTRADYGKIKPLLRSLQHSQDFEIIVIATGMHTLAEFGLTINEVIKDKVGELHTFSNQSIGDNMENVLANTILRLSETIKTLHIDLLVVHGDRVEAIAGAIVGAFNNLRVAHIEGGEVSGTIDGSIRHAITKFAHGHFVSNSEAANRLIQLGENPQTVFEIGSPDTDAILNDILPSIDETKSHYEIPFEKYGILIFHPVTTEINSLKQQALNIIEGLIQTKLNFIVIRSNNDYGYKEIEEAYKNLAGNKNFKWFPSIRFESFLSLLKNADFIIGNSSAGIREAQYFNVPAINIGTRQKNRSKSNHIVNINPEIDEVINAIKNLKNLDVASGLKLDFGVGNSGELFLKTLNSPEFWKIPIDKTFIDLQ
jgi:UDP-N-acetylglucosamine 2-epimerase (hydrolysing)